MKCSPGDGVCVATNLSYIPNDSHNIAAKTVSAFFDYTRIKGYRADIKIEKHIPVCAGLGGGSSDAACVLRMLDEIFETKLGREELEKLGGTVGADVPFCIDGGTKLAEGTGDILTDLELIPDSYIVICKPKYSCSTPENFSRVKCEKLRARPDTDGIIKALAEGNIGAIARRMYNVFEDVLAHGKDDIDMIKGVLHDNNALGAIMTGSGPAVFGLFDDCDNAKRAHNALLGDYKDCFLATTLPSFGVC